MIRKYTLTYFALIGFLILTCAIAYLNLGVLNTTLALVIAAAKAVLVALFFMHLSLTGGLTRIFAGAGLFWLAILITLSLSDFLSRGWLALPGRWPG